ncbi:glutamate carboxypeptidase 2 isoform X2 [Tripterygium wilfordii]|uniref:glutamate carboxypeptidase II n=1 Tax=Tripterygium wilfordii TaxID=458696 RepID=A0A7J7DN04_TRIWF|nr:probable glutamate carboxypeptidase AMP1 [Tripterygium wilfordii]KAF5747750.1 glutamate carboxypeptidase 2 isoform X2 [Tripterygium wilfordii]
MALTTTLFASKPPPPLCSYLFFLLLCIFGFYTFHHPHLRNPQKTLDHYHNLFLSTANNSTIATYLRALTLHPHLAGTAASLGTTNYVYTQFQTLGLKTHQTHYKALLSYPVHSSLAAHFSNGTRLYLNLNEKGVAPDVVPPYHAYSPSGSAYAKVVFVNFGREEDYRALGVVGVNVSGCVLIARKGGGLSRGGVVRGAEAKGALAVLLYTEGDMGGGVERGTVMSGVGDPQSPGWAGVEGGERLSFEDSEVLNRFPKIPSMPLSPENADVILGSLGGPAVPQRWRDSLRSRVSRVGPGPTMVNFTYQAEKKVATIHNVFAIIRGREEVDRYVLLGNHRDAWTYGAVDPNSGTAALLDIARRYALLVRMGWNPRRTIVFCSWDAEEFGMIGSTEWVEQNLVNLDAKAVTYLNVDCAVQGPGFFAAATPQLDNLLIDVTKKVKDPDMEGATVYEEWTSTNRVTNIQRLSGVDSDFAPFLQHAGIPSIDIYYGGEFPVYHTAFDSYDWITTYADPLFQRHIAVAGVWGLLALRLADDSVLPFNYLSYAYQLQRHKDVLSSLLDESTCCISLEPLTRSIQELAAAATVAEDEAKRLRDQEIKDDFGVLKLRALNDRLMLAERGFLDADGLRGRQWFKHLIYGPQGDYESKLTFFPGIADAIHRSQKMNKRDGHALIRSEIWRVARAIGRAASALKGELT